MLAVFFVKAYVGLMLIKMVITSKIIFYPI